MSSILVLEECTHSVLTRTARYCRYFINTASHQTYSNRKHYTQVYSWGCNDDCALGRETADEDEAAVPSVVNIDEKVVQITAGDSHSAALTETGKVYAWGSFRVSNSFTQRTIVSSEYTST